MFFPDFTSQTLAVVSDWLSSLNKNSLSHHHRYELRNDRCDEVCSHLHFPDIPICMPRYLPEVCHRAKMRARGCLPYVQLGRESAFQFLNSIV